MSAALPEPNSVLTREEYRRWCASQPRGRFERIDGRVVIMSPERMSHVDAKGRVYVELRRAIAAAGVPCKAFGDGATVEMGNNDYEPDALVNCGEPVDGTDVAAPNPVVVVEVLSPRTAMADTGDKLAGYFRVPSVHHYLIVHPTQNRVTHHRRTDAGVLATILFGGLLPLDPPGITLLIDNFYTDTPTAP